MPSARTLRDEEGTLAEVGFFVSPLTCASGSLGGSGVGLPSGTSSSKRCSEDKMGISPREARMRLQASRMS